jgi:hypothetical protein
MENGLTEISLSRQNLGDICAFYQLEPPERPNSHDRAGVV